MSAVDDLTELVERAGAAEREALASKWKDRADVESLRRHVRRVLDEQRAAERREPLGGGSDERRLRVRSALIEDTGDTTDATDTAATGSPVTHADAARAEGDAAAAVTVARLALVEAHLAVLDARLARLDAGESAPEAASVDGHTVLSGRTAVGRHGPALAHGLRGEIGYMLTRRPRTLLKSLAVSLALGLLYLGVIRLFQWDTKAQYLPYLGLWTVSVVMGGAVCLNAMSFDGMRVRAALESGARLWHLLVTKNLALVCLVAPIGFLLSALLSWRAGSWDAFLRACALTISFIVLWLGAGNVASVLVPIRDEPIWHRLRDGTLKQFAVVFAVSYVLGYAVNLMLIVRVFAAQEWVQRSGVSVLPAVFVVLSSITMWVLLTIVAVALSQQPKVRRRLMKELVDAPDALVPPPPKSRQG